MKSPPASAAGAATKPKKDNRSPKQKKAAEKAASAKAAEAQVSSTVSWTQPVPVPPYLIALAAGELEVRVRV